MSIVFERRARTRGFFERKSKFEVEIVDFLTLLFEFNEPPEQHA